MVLAPGVACWPPFLELVSRSFSDWVTQKVALSAGKLTNEARELFLNALVMEGEHLGSTITCWSR
jgi:hypothetical protein